MSSNIPAAPPVKKAGERTMSPDELDRLATQLMESGFIETAADLRIAAHAWRQDIAKQVSGFFEDEAPTYQQGAPTHELQHLITAEDCTRLYWHSQQPVEALRWLVALKDIKDNPESPIEKQQQYEREKPWAWHEARRVLNGDKAPSLAALLVDVLRELNTPDYFLPECYSRLEHRYVAFDVHVDLQVLNAARSRVGLPPLKEPSNAT